MAVKPPRSVSAFDSASEKILRCQVRGAITHLQQVFLEIRERIDAADRDPSLEVGSIGRMIVKTKTSLFAQTEDFTATNINENLTGLDGLARNQAVLPVHP